MNKYISILFFILILGCNDDTVDSVDTFDGRWVIVSSLMTDTCEIEKGADYMNYCGDRYDGAGTDTHFEGLFRVITDEKVTLYKLILSRTGNKLDGEMKITVSVNGQSSTGVVILKGYKI